MECSLVDEDDLTSPVVDLELIVLPEGFLVGCVVLVAVFPVDGTGHLEGSVDSFLLGLAAELSDLSADVVPGHALATRSSSAEGLGALGDSPGALLVAVVLGPPSDFDIQGWHCLHNIVLLIHFGLHFALASLPVEVCVVSML